MRPLSSPSLAPAPGQITAGVWDDLARWAFWRGLDANPDKRWAAEQWRLFPTARLRVHVSSGALSVSDARVRLRNQANQTLWRGRTDIHGRVNVFWGVNAMRQPGPFSLEVQAPSGYKTVRRIATGQTHMNVDLDTQNRASAAVDIMFMVDTTGSMGDELEYLKSEIKSVVRRVQQKHGDRLDLRLSVNFYRDRGDAYVVCSFPFGRDIEQVVRQIAAQQADGGGDFEESVELALHGAVAHHAWRQEARARVLFLVLDAPPHATAEIQQKVMDAVRQAARRGIRIIPVASSGIDKPTEFFLRGLSLVTNGKYVFLTDDSGIGNAHLEPTIGHYQIDYLNNILVKILTQATTGAKPN